MEMTKTKKKKKIVYPTELVGLGGFAEMVAKVKERKNKGKAELPHSLEELTEAMRKPRKKGKMRNGNVKGRIYRGLEEVSVLY